MPKIIKIFILLIFLILCITQQQCSQKENIRSKHIREFMTYCYENRIFNGTVLVAENGKILFNEALGLADLESQRALDLNTAFYLASVSKQFTSMALMILKEQGKLTFEDTLSHYFPEFPDYARQITIRHLLTHTSGIPDHFDLGGYKPDLTNRDVFNLLIKQDSLEFNPGEKYSYSNGNYVLLSMIIEKTSGQPFHEFLKHHIFRPLNMDQSLVYDESKPVLENRATGYTMFGERDDYNLLTTGAGGIYSTTQDLYKWDQALYHKNLVGPATLLEAFSAQQLKNGTSTNYGFGWAVAETADGKIVSHGGGLGGFRTYIERQLGKKRTIIFLTNLGDALPLGEMIEGLHNILDYKPFTYPKIPLSITLQQIIKSNGLTQAIADFNQLKKSQAHRYDFSEEQLNSLGYYLLRQNKNAEAIEIFKLNIEAYPQSSNTYDSLGEAYMKNGAYQLAVQYYQKSLELDPNNHNAREMIKQINEQKR